MSEPEMSESAASDHELQGSRGTIVYRVWTNPDADHLIFLVHGYGEHVGRYEWVADTLVRNGAAVYAPDHLGHGRSAGERVLVSDYEDVDADLQQLIRAAKADHPDLPSVLIGHSMGGMIGARYAQKHPGELTALVLSGPVLGTWSGVTDLLDLAEIPDDPLDVSTLSRDPEIGEIYAADPLVYHGPFKRETILAMQRALATIADGPALGDLPTLWVHGAEDALVPLIESRPGVEALGLTDLDVEIYPGARHEVFNETNKSEVLQRVTDFIDRVLGR